MTSSSLIDSHKSMVTWRHLLSKAPFRMTTKLHWSGVLENLHFLCVSKSLGLSGRKRRLRVAERPAHMDEKKKVLKKIHICVAQALGLGYTQYTACVFPHSFGEAGECCCCFPNPLVNFNVPAIYKYFVTSKSMELKMYLNESTKVSALKCTQSIKVKALIVQNVQFHKLMCTKCIEISRSTSLQCVTLWRIVIL